MSKQAFRKQQLRTWKLQQQQRHLEEKRRHDEERRHREDEIRRIRDLSNQDEQYNRFMKLVGGARPRTRSKVRSSTHVQLYGVWLCPLLYSFSLPLSPPHHLVQRL